MDLSTIEKTLSEDRQKIQHYMDECVRLQGELNQAVQDKNRAYLIGYEDGRAGNRCDFKKLNADA